MLGNFSSLRFNTEVGDTCPSCSAEHNFILNESLKSFQCNVCKKMLKFSPVSWNLQHVFSVCTGRKTDLSCPACATTDLFTDVVHALPYHHCFCLKCKHSFPVCDRKTVQVELVHPDTDCFRGMVEV